MAQKLSSHFIDLVYDALLKSFWRKKTLLNFLRRHNISENFLASWHETESKRDFLTRLLPAIEKNPRNIEIIQRIASSLADQNKFPDLEGWEDAKQKQQAASDAVDALRRCIGSHKDEAEEIRAREEHKRADRAQINATIAKGEGLGELSQRLTDISTQLGTSAGGYDFQNWFFDLVTFFEMTSRRPYVVGGRQIDGSITVEGTTYLIELKFGAKQSDVTDVDSLFNKVNDKADNTMGILVSMSGFSAPAIQQASGRRTPLLLMDSGHIYLVLAGPWSLPEVVAKLRRHASQTGQAYLLPAEFAK